MVIDLEYPTQLLKLIFIFTMSIQPNSLYSKDYYFIRPLLIVNLVFKTQIDHLLIDRRFRVILLSFLKMKILIYDSIYSYDDIIILYLINYIYFSLFQPFGKTNYTFQLNFDLLERLKIKHDM